MKVFFISQETICLLLLKSVLSVCARGASSFHITLMHNEYWTTIGFQTNHAQAGLWIYFQRAKRKFPLSAIEDGTILICHHISWAGEIAVILVLMLQFQKYLSMSVFQPQLFAIWNVEKGMLQTSLSDTSPLKCLHTLVKDSKQP